MSNAAEPSRQEELQREIARRTADNDFRWLMNDPRGRRFIWRMMGHCKVFEQTFNTHGGLMNFNEGQRNVGLFLLGEINRLCPDKFAVAADENKPQPVEDGTDE